jgi:predicted transcriptional regulator
MLSRLEAKGYVTHEIQENRYIYRSATQSAKVRESALRQFVQTFYDGSAVSAAATLLRMTKHLKPEEAAALQRAIDEAQKA